MTSFLEQSVVVKGDSACIVGSSVRGTIWSSLLTDFLLAKMLKLEKYEKVICVGLDRRDVDILTALPAGDRERVIVVGDSNANNYADMLAEWEKVVETSKGSGSSRKSVALVVFSISELVLRYDLNSAVKIVKEVSRWGLGSFITSLHSTLHSLNTRMRIEDLFTSVLYVNPNDGSFSDEVHAEVQTVRKSVNTGKVSEATELFGLRGGEGSAKLVCIHRKKVVPESDASTGATNIVAAPVAADAAVEIHRASQGSKRLVTFDSADPEFDEDSDPDADLDL